MRAIVDLPMPLRPIRPTISPAAKLISGRVRSGCFLSQPSVTPSSVSTGVPGHRALCFARIPARQSSSVRARRPYPVNVSAGSAANSAADHCAARRPAAKKKYLSARSVIQARRCSASTTVTPCRFITAIISCSCAMAAASRLLVGSSSTNSRGPSIQAAANATRCFSPPDSLKTLRSISGPSWNCSTTSSTRRRMACGSMPAFSQGKASSAVVSTLKYWVLGFWNTLPTCGT